MELEEARPSGWVLGPESPASQRVGWRAREHLSRIQEVVSAKSGVGMSYLVRQIEPQRGVSHSTQDGITGSAGPGGEGGAKAAADENLPKTGKSGKPSFPLCSGHTASLQLPPVT